MVYHNNECINKVFKNDVAAKLSIPQCIEKIEEFLNSQSCQFQLATTGEGLYRFRENYRDLEVSKEEWLAKSKDDKKKHVAKVLGCQVRPVVNIQNNAPTAVNIQHKELGKTNLSTPIQRSKTISVSHLESGLSAAIPPHSLCTMWNKAEKIINSEGDISMAIGKFHNDDRARQVGSESNPRQPHFVYQYNTGKVVCDNCPLYQAFKICQHSIAVAEVRGSLSLFLKWRKSVSKGQHSAENLTKSSLPMATTGKKKTERKRLPKKRISSTTVQNFVDPLDVELGLCDERLSSAETTPRSTAISKSADSEIQISSGRIQKNIPSQVMRIREIQQIGFLTLKKLNSAVNIMQNDNECSLCYIDSYYATCCQTVYSFFGTPGTPKII